MQSSSWANWAYDSPGGLNVAHATKRLSFFPAQVRASEREARDRRREPSSFGQIFLQSGRLGEGTTLCRADVAAWLRPKNQGSGFARVSKERVGLGGRDLRAGKRAQQPGPRRGDHAGLRSA